MTEEGKIESKNVCNLSPAGSVPMLIRMSIQAIL